jgi:hypothetical protein
MTAICRQSTFLDHRSTLPRYLLLQQGYEESLYSRPWGEKASGEVSGIQRNASAPKSQQNEFDSRQ